MPAAGMQWLIIDLTEPSGDRALRRAALAEHVLQRRDLGLVAERNAGAVRLDQADAGRIDAAAVVGAADRQRLALDAGREQAVAAAVAGLADAAQHRVDAVAVARARRRGA